MANKRILKKNINYLCSELIAECVSALQYGKAKKEDVKNVVSHILIMQDDMTRRVSHIEPGWKAKAYFRRLLDDLTVKTEEIIEQINGLI